jgi:hypothetical protein
MRHGPIQADPVLFVSVLLYKAASSTLIGIECGPAMWALGVNFVTMPAMLIVSHVACERAQASLAAGATLRYDHTAQAASTV